MQFSTMDKTVIVKAAFDKFLKVHLPHSSIGSIDDIVLNYLVGSLEEIGNDDGFDVEDFMDMMEAYIPGFDGIASATICEWIFQLSGEVLSSARTKVESEPKTHTTTKDTTGPRESFGVFESMELPYTLPADYSNRQQESDSRSRNSSLTQNSNPMAQSPRTSDENLKLLLEMFSSSCKAEAKQCLSDSYGDMEQAIQAMLHLENQRTRGRPLEASSKLGQQEAAALGSDEKIHLFLEMFTCSSKLQARRCLSIAKGDLEQASRVLLDLQELGEIEEHENNAVSSIERSSDTNEKHMKASLLQKYGYIDTDDDRKNHKPMEPKKEKKKMIRYINSQTVTTKGERFIETKKPETEEMKKTSTNLKPARKYHFH